jgi:hypothetical protein
MFSARIGFASCSGLQFVVHLKFVHDTYWVAPDAACAACPDASSTEGATARTDVYACVCPAGFEPDNGEGAVKAPNGDETLLAIINKNTGKVFNGKVYMILTSTLSHLSDTSSGPI